MKSFRRTAALLGILLAGTPAVGRTDPGKAPDHDGNWTHFDCGKGYHVAVAFGANDLGEPGAKVRLPEGELYLKGARSGSGARYAYNGNELWTKGDEALLTLEGSQMKRCRRTD